MNVTIEAKQRAANLAKAGRNDHEVVKFRGRLVPVLGTVGGTEEQSRETARNIERYFAWKKGGGA